MKEIPAVSVIIPLYNAEKYIGECLDSILEQTLQDFEVIIVDDCSTDSSVKVVESYAEKFNGRLRLEKTLSNSGSPGVPGNMGIRFSRGEYLLILDNDDTITPDALEKLYSTAKEFDADVVACEKYYKVPAHFFNNAEVLAKIQPHSYQKGGFVDKPTLLENDPSKRVVDCVQRKFLWNIWSKLIRRDVVIRNDLHFTDNLIQDMIFTCCLIFTAEKIVRVPYVVNRYRVIEDSLSHKTDSLNEYLNNYFRALRTGFEYLDGFLSVRPFFQQHPEIKCMALNNIVNECFSYFAKVYYGNVPGHLLEGFFRQKVAAENFSPALSAALLNNANIFYAQFKLTQRRIIELENEIRQLKSKE